MGTFVYVLCYSWGLSMFVFQLLSADEAVRVMLDHLTDANSATHLNIPPGKPR